MDDLGDQVQELKILDKIPVFIGDGHYQVLDFIYRYIDSGHLPKQGNTIVHLDALPDDIIPKEMLNRTALEKGAVRSDLFWHIGISNWIHQTAVAGRLGHVIWVKPPWSKQADDGDGICTVQKSDGTTEDVTVDIKTIGKIENDNGDDLLYYDFDGLASIAQKYLTATDPYILDIDLSYFSTNSPFATLYENANIFPMVQKLFAYKEPASKDEKDIKEANDYRIKQMKELNEYFMYLKEHQTMPPVDGEPSEVYLEVALMREKILSEYKDTIIDWNHIFNGGTATNCYHLPYHIRERKHIEAFWQSCFVKILKALPCPPTIITIARSCEYDCYAPQKDCNFMERNLLKCLRENYVLDNPEMPYLDY